MALLDYPENFLDEEGNPKPGVYGPSPASMGLLSAGLGMLSSPTYSRIPGDMSGIGQGAMQGLQAYQNRMNQIQQQRKDYNQSLMQAQNQEMAKQRFALEMGEAKRIEGRRKQMVSELPNLLEQMRSLPIPGIDQQIASIQAMANAGATEKAYQAAVTIMGQKIPTKSNVKHKLLPGTNAGYIYDETTGQFLGQFTTGETKKYGTTLAGQDAFEYMKELDPAFELDGPISNLVVERHPDNTLKNVKYIRGKTGALNDAESKLLERTLNRWGQHPLLKAADLAISQYLTLEELGKSNPDGKMGVQDVAMIFGFMKALDPTSVVRESEYATAANAGIGVPEQIWRAYNKAIDGEILLPEVRKEIIATAKKAVKAKRKQLESVRSSFLKRGKLLKVPESEMEFYLRNPYSILDEPTETPPPPKVTEVPEPGSVEDANAANIAAEVAASLDLIPKEPEKLKRKVKRNNAGRAYEVQVLPGDGASKILQAAGIKYSEENIKALIRANKKRFNKNRELVSSGGYLLIPKAIRQ